MDGSRKSFKLPLVEYNYKPISGYYYIDRSIKLTVSDNEH